MINNPVEEEIHFLHHQETSFESHQVFLFPPLIPLTEPRFGFDSKILEIHHEFRGLVGITCGAHFFWFDVVNHGRVSFFVWFEPETIFAPAYDIELDQFECTEPFREQDVLMIVNSYENFLCNYTENQDEWTTLTQHITRRLLDSVLPAKNYGQMNSSINFFSMSHEVSCAEKCKHLGLVDVDVKRWAIENRVFKFESGSLLCFSSIPFLVLKKEEETLTFTNLIGQDVEFGSFSSILKNYNHDVNAMGELEFSFVVFWYGNVAAAADQWLRIVHFLCLISSEVFDYQKCFCKFLSTLRSQLEVISCGFFSKHVATNNWVADSLPLIQKNIGENEEINEDLRQKAQDVHLLLSTKFKLETSTRDFCK